jgi:hypothetical protein
MIKEIGTRLKHESPSFFKKIQAIGISLGAIGTALMAIPAETVELPEVVGKLSGYFIVAGIVAAAIAKTTVSDPSVLKKDEVPAT